MTPPGVISVPGAPRVLLAPVEALVRRVPVEADAAPAHDDWEVPAHQLRILEDTRLRFQHKLLKK